MDAYSKDRGSLAWFQFQVSKVAVVRDPSIFGKPKPKPNCGSPHAVGKETLPLKHANRNGNQASGALIETPK